MEKISNEKKKSKKKKVAIIVVSSVAAFLLVALICSYFIIGNYFFKFALDATFAAVYNSPNDVVLEMPMPKLETEWFNGVEKSVEEIESDGYKLKAYKILAENSEHRWAIIVHGYRGQAADMSHYALKFHQAGFNVLMPDLKGHGNSEGKYIGMGYSDSKDILKWIDLIIEEDSLAQIVLHGVSMGAATVMCATGLELPINVVCAIEDCGYSNVYDQFEYVAKDIMKLPLIPVIMSAADVFVKSRMGVSLKEMSPVDALKKSTTPTLFIHGSKDNFVPFYMLDEVFNANKNLVKQKLVIEGASHGYSATLNETLYFETVFNFVNNYLNNA